MLEGQGETGPAELWGGGYADALKETHCSGGSGTSWHNRFGRPFPGAQPARVFSILTRPPSQVMSPPQA